MTVNKLNIEPLTQQAFSAFGDVIETDQRSFRMINNGSTRRYHSLSQVETAFPADGDQAIISIFRAQVIKMPLTIRMLERHPLGSQAFVPLLGRPFLIVVAPPTSDEKPQTDLIRAFITNGK